MTKNPLVNALAALTYIFGVATLLFNMGKWMGGRPDTVFAPVAAVSLFTLSAAVMGAVFLYQPFELYFNDKKKNAIKLFGQTLMWFALLTVLIFTLLITGVFSSK